MKTLKTAAVAAFFRTKCCMVETTIVITSEVHNLGGSHGREQSIMVSKI